MASETENTTTKTSKPNLNMVLYPDKFLRFKAQPFTQEQISTQLVKNVAGAMIKKMYELHGVGLSAQQVGVPNQIFVMDHQFMETGKRKPKIFLNPQLMFADTENAIEMTHPGEGCLSLPYGFKSPVPRHAEIQLNWVDIKGQFQSDWFEGFEAIVIQHEMDHLEGHIFPDRLSLLKQDMFNRRVRKVRRQYSKGYKRGLQTLKHAPRTPEYARRRAQTWEQERRNADISSS